MLFFSLFKTLTDQQITVEFKNNVEITGTLKSVDQYLNLKLDNIQYISDEDNEFPHLFGVKSLFIRGSGIRYIHIDPSSVDTNLLQDASRREAMASSGNQIGK
ncbi:Lsm (Like Sm) protein involved in RNA processing [Komagataella phaffii CBS 7435]|uniref:Lsm (Like Sm) protein involved in RNA processing n=1 Tax=Komagataella phaffii (strain ATCC 76273 / CBS 7435 / CECT 11047 / NRRL Y-11430 / Wegner 21-1) TaxID=981350 RepID=F2QZ68_KOMPC|nr:Lsm (Like Sm) protein involved in RNA processing [Komagataella phaffii CBS 7435]CCA40696.1 Lsm (Like Sm) protein involved in RNA processing [Komagataella phaffii CBS 7435]